MWIYFTDPVLRAPTIGCMLMCVVAALAGVVVFLRKQSLLGESLSHASYPGVITGVLVSTLFTNHNTSDLAISLGIIFGAFSTAFLGLWVIHFLERKNHVASDAALCFVLSSFFGMGLTLASRVQFTHTYLYQQIQVYLYGQAATMTDIHILIYGILALVMMALIVFVYKELQIITLDRSYAKSLGIPVKTIDFFIFFMVVFAIVIGIRSVGVVLISAMLIAPPVAARQYTNKLYAMFLLSALFGMFSGFLGNVFSVELSHSITSHGSYLVFPTGPMIVLVASLICVISLLVAPERGLLLRLWRIVIFRYRRICENILKMLWRRGEKEETSFADIHKYQNTYSITLHFILWRLTRARWLKKTKDSYSLTFDGFQRAARIVRLHRLWEVYLVDYLGVGSEKVHYDAEEMEHIITPELEMKLTELLNDPKRDPHYQPIPPRNSVTGYGK